MHRQDKMNMKKAIILPIFFTCFLLFQKSVSIAGTDNPTFILDKLGNNIYEGVFTGNGLLGTMTYTKDIQYVRIDIGRTDVYDHRPNLESALFDKARLPLGHFSLAFPDTIKKAYGEIDYIHAEASAFYTVGNENCVIKTISFSQQDIIYIEISKGRRSLPDLVWIPEKAQSPRMHFDHATKQEYYPDNPVGYTLQKGDIQVYIQPLLAGGGYAVAYKKIEGQDKDYYVVTASYAQQGQKFVEEAIQNIQSFKTTSLPRLIEEHRSWWKEYYNRSTLAVPDKSLQQFYELQRYKLACATRYDKPAIDLQGPWTSSTPWPAYWHNLNIQLTYSPTFASNHLDIAHSLIAMIDRNFGNLIQNVPEPYRYNSAAIGRSSSPDMISPVYVQKGLDNEAWDDGRKELGNLTWMLHSYYQYYRYTMDTAVYDRLFPLLKRAINYYIHLLEKDNNGKYHISVRTYSPEYPQGYAYDTNYDLSILKWGLKTLIALDGEREGNDKFRGQWSDILDNLRPYPQDSTGFMIAKDLPYAISHRHYSHLMMIYPFYDMHWDDLDNRELIERSVAHWQSKKSYLQGYSFSGVASMYAMMGKGDQALEALHILLEKYVKPNTLYAETGPVIETPLSAMATIQELVLQHWNGYTRVFPAVPNAWRDVSFENFLTDGAFLLSATRKNGQTENIIIESQHSGEIKLKFDMDNPAIKIDGKGKVLEIGIGKVTLYLEKGATANLSI
jgi:alpha-L-fucosidase 2